MKEFEGYGKLEWLDPEQYYAEPWKPLAIAEDAEGEKYDIVIKGSYPCELRYTNI